MRSSKKRKLKEEKKRYYSWYCTKCRSVLFVHPASRNPPKCCGEVLHLAK